MTSSIDADGACVASPANRAIISRRMPVVQRRSSSNEAVRWYRTLALLGKAQAYEATERGAEAEALRERLGALLRDADARVGRVP